MWHNVFGTQFPQGVKCLCFMRLRACSESLVCTMKITKSYLIFPHLSIEVHYGPKWTKHSIRKAIQMTVCLSWRVWYNELEITWQTSTACTVLSSNDNSLTEHTKSGHFIHSRSVEILIPEEHIFRTEHAFRSKDKYTDVVKQQFIGSRFPIRFFLIGIFYVIWLIKLEITRFCIRRAAT